MIADIAKGGLKMPHLDSIIKLKRLYGAKDMQKVIITHGKNF